MSLGNVNRRSPRLCYNIKSHQWLRNRLLVGFELLLWSLASSPALTLDHSTRTNAGIGSCQEIRSIVRRSIWSPETLNRMSHSSPDGKLSFDRNVSRSQ